jgi:hypothetical protein
VLARRGTTLVELVVALALLALVLGPAVSSLLRQQRTAARTEGVGEVESQRLAAVAPLAGALAGLAPAQGDVAPGEASDTSLGMRATVAVGVACGASPGATVLGPVDDGPGISGDAVRLRAGDSLWWYATASGWVARRIQEVRSVPGRCVGREADTASATSVVVGLADTVPAGAPLRITRPVRYVFYRASDGSLQLGLREWAEAIHGLGGPQPLTGPFLPHLVDGRRTGFRYFNASGAELASNVPDVSRIARIRLTLLTPERAGSRGADVVRRDSLDVPMVRTTIGVGAP